MRKPKKPVSSRPRVVREVVLPREEPIEIVDDHEPPSEAELSYESFIGGFPQDGLQIKVYREGERREYCFRAKPHELQDAHEAIRLYHAKQPYCAERGEYTLEVFVNGEARNSFTIYIAPQVPVSPAPSPYGSMAGDSTVRLLMEQNARLEALLRNQSSDREPIGALADAMLKLQQIQGNARPQEMPIDTVMKCIELGKTLSGGEGGGGDDWKSILSPILPYVMPILQTVMQPKPPALAQPSPAVEGNPASMPNEDQMILAGIQFLKQKCLARAHPGLYVEFVYDNKDAPQYQGLIRRILAGELSEFAKLDPEITKEPYADFFKYFFDGLRSAFNADNPMAGDTGGPRGDAPNASNNGATLKAVSKKH